MIRDPVARIEALLAKTRRAFRIQFLAMVEQMRDALTLRELEDLLARGRYDVALGLLQARAASLGVLWSTEFATAARGAAGFMRETAGLQVVFDQTHYRAVDAMRQNQLRLVREFTAEQTKATREALLEGIERGVNPKQQALAFRDSIGLTQNQERAVLNYRRALEQGSPEALQRALRDRRFDGAARAAVDGAKLPRAQVDKMVEAYRERMIDYRARVIARTEALRSVHEGNAEAYKQAIDAGELNPGQLWQTWNTASDARVRDSHRSMNQQTRPFGEPFTSGNGNSLRYPGDPAGGAADSIQCRCAVGTRILNAEEAAAAAAGRIRVTVIG